MFTRSMALCSVFALATVAQGGVDVQLVPTPNLALYPPSSVVQVDVKLVQTGGSDQNLRMIEFDTQTTNSLLALTMPLTHNRGTPAPGDDINFWFFGSRPTCVSTPSTCGSDHYIDFSLPAGPVDTRLNVLSMAFHALSANANQIVLPGGGTPVTVGKLTVTLPAIGGTYTLNLMNKNDLGADRGARLDFGFDPHTTWRARDTAPNNLTGGTLTFEVCPGPGPCGGPAVVLDGWTTVKTHGGVGEVGLIIPDTGLFSEPRAGISKIVVSFDGALNPATVTPANVTVCGNDLADSPVDLTGVVITTGTTTGDTKMEINFAPALPNLAKYRIALKTTILGANGGAIVPGAGGLSRILTAIQGDYANGGDRRVNATDLGGVRNLVGINPINPATLNEVRADANNSGNISATDLALVRARVGQDARAISDPVCP